MIIVSLKYLLKFDTTLFAYIVAILDLDLAIGVSNNITLLKPFQIICLCFVYVHVYVCVYVCVCLCMCVGVCVGCVCCHDKM